MGYVSVHLSRMWMARFQNIIFSTCKIEKNVVIVHRPLLIHRPFPRLRVLNISIVYVSVSVSMLDQPICSTGVDLSLAAPHQ